jgi:hypothetical protein
MIKTIIIFMAALALSSDTFAFGSTAKTETHNQQPMAPIMDVAFYSQNLQTGSIQKAIERKSSSSEAMIDKQHKLVIEFYVYLIIIMIYSLYWLKVS